LKIKSSQLNETEFESILRATEKHLLSKTKPEPSPIYIRSAFEVAWGVGGIDLELGRIELAMVTNAAVFLLFASRLTLTGRWAAVGSSIAIPLWLGNG
jgi:hypothetical protein